MLSAPYRTLQRADWPVYPVNLPIAWVWLKLFWIGLVLWWIVRKGEL
jgi:hypothetical protein